MTDEITELANKKIWKKIGLKCCQISLMSRKPMLVFCKVENKSKKVLILMNLVRRNECNLHAVYELSLLSYKKTGSTYYKLPVGLLLRNCLMDCLTGLYVCEKNEEFVRNLVEQLNAGYVKSLYERFEVFKDKIEDFHLDDSFMERIYLLSIEDNFIHYLLLNGTFKKENPSIENDIWKVSSKKCGPKLNNLHSDLKSNSVYRKYSEKLYAYYKYFSQYEHFSENGHGDSLVPFGNDNIDFPKTLDYIEKVLDIMITSANVPRL